MSATSIPRLRALPAGRDLLDRWAADEPGPGSPVEKLQRAVLAHTRVDPAASLDAVERVVRSSRRLPPADRARLTRLEGHVLRLTGRVAEAAARYRKASGGFAAAGERAERGLTAIGWVDALNLAGKFTEALRVGRDGRRFLSAADPLAHARLDTNLAVTYYWTGRYREAAARTRAARERFRKGRDPFAAALASFNLGNACLRIGRPGEAGKLYREALAVFRRRKLRVPELYARHGLAALDLAQGRWEEGIEALRSMEDELSRLGDPRAVAALHREIAGLLASLGATEAARPAAAAAFEGYRRLGLGHEAAAAALLQARVFAAGGAFHDAEVRLDQAVATFREEGNAWAGHLAEVERSAVYLRRGHPEKALAGTRRAQAYLDRRDPRGAGARCRAVAAEARLALGEAAPAGRAARLAHARARDYPARLERPWMALLAARSASVRGRGSEALRWSARGVDELERLLVRFGSRGLRTLAAGSRDLLYREAVDLTLRHGGRNAAARAVDLLSRARSPRLVEDLLHGRGREVDEEIRSSLARLRDDLLASEDPGEGDVRFRSIREEAARLEAGLGSGPRRPPRVVREAVAVRRLRDWRERLGERELVLYDRGADAWRAFVVRRRGRVDVVDLPRAEAALRDAWLPLRLLFETAARAPRPRRAVLLERTLDEARNSLAALRRALWDPLPLTRSRVVLVPAGALHALPLESLAFLDAAGPVAVSRIPHPALLGAPVPRRRREALLLSGPEPGARDEVARVGEVLARAGFSVAAGDRRRDLRGASRIGVLHVAAHGTFHREGWLLSGVRLADGWLGFEELRQASVRNALLYFSSCESGLSEEMPGAELDGWIAAGLGAGAREMVLTLWKVDDDAATAFAESFYPGWAGGRPAPEAAGEARRKTMARFPHPYSWSPFIAVG